MHPLWEDIVRKIMVLTGKRGGYGAMKPMLRLIRDDPELELQLVVGSQHWSPDFGSTHAEVEQEFTNTIHCDGWQSSNSDDGWARSRCLAREMLDMTFIGHDSAPDILVLMGDRAESLVAAVVATQLNIPIAHIQGGDVTGGIDNPQRNAISKLAHVHFTSCSKSTHRLHSLMGEENWCIHEVGDLHVDPIVQMDYLLTDAVHKRLDLNESPIIVLQHPDTYSPDSSSPEMQKTLKAVDKLGQETVVIYPCSDQGYEGIIRVIKHSFRDNWQVHKNLPSPLFLGLMNIASVIVGNSSAGIIEAPYFGLRAVDIGYRQKGRLSCDLTKWVPHDSSLIAQAIKESIDAGPGKVNDTLYGDGHAGERVVKVLKELEINDKLMRK